MTLKYLLALVFSFGLSAVRADDLALSSKVPCSCAELGEKLEALSREVFELKGKVEELRRTRYPVEYPVFDGVHSLFHTTEGKGFTNLHSEKLEALNSREIFGQKAELEELTHPERIPNHLVFERFGVLSLFSSTERLALQTPPGRSLSLSLYSSTLD